MSLCGPWTFRVRSRDGGQWSTFKSPEWEIEFARSQAASVDINVSDCGPVVDAVEWCDWIEAWCGDELADRWILTGKEPDGEGGLTLTGESLVELLKKRRWPATRTLSGPAGRVWFELWQEANSIGDTGICPVVSSGGPLVQIGVEAGDTIDDAADTLSTYVTFTQQGGALYDWLAGEEPRGGRPLSQDWITDFGCGTVGEFDARSVANDLLFKYGPSLDNTYRWPPLGPSDDCVVQSGVLEFPEIVGREQIVDLAATWGPLVAAPEPVLDSVQFDPALTRLGDLLPGVWHRMSYGPHKGYDFNLAVAVVSGVFDCVETVEAGFDQGDNDIRRRLLS